MHIHVLAFGFRWSTNPRGEMCSFVTALKKHIESSSQFYYSRFIFFLVYNCCVYFAFITSWGHFGLFFCFFLNRTANVKLIKWRGFRMIKHFTPLLNGFDNLVLVN